jgi:hypothetical protein
MAQEIFEKWGFGLAPPKPETAAKRLKWAAHVLSVIDSRTELGTLTIDLEAISEVKGLFNRIVKQDQWDWFSMSGQLGYPSTRVSHAIAYALTGLRSGLRDQDLASAALARSTLQRLPARKCLRVFVGKARIRDEPDAGWVYLLSTREIKDLLKIGMTTRTVEERVREINAATGVAIPFGVRACWRVTNPAAAEKLIHATFVQWRIRSDREFFRVDFFDAKKRIIDLLKEHQLEIRTLDNLTALEE